VEKLRFLIAEDDNDDLFLIKDFIRDGKFGGKVQVDHVVSMDEVLDKAIAEPYDIIFLDLSLGEWNGMEILRNLREGGYKPPIILLTGQGDQALAVEAMKAGATDYLTKGNLSIEGLAGAVRNSIRFYEQQKQKDRAENALRVQSKLLRGVSEAANRLLNVFDHECAVQEAVNILGESSGLKSIYIYQNESGAKTNPLCFISKINWVNGQDLDNFNVDKVIINDPSEELKTWLNDLKILNLSKGKSSDVPQPLGEIFLNKGIYSTLIYPISINLKFWGFIVFGCDNSGRSWSKDEETIFMTAVSSFEGEIKRHEDSMAFRSIIEGTSSRTGDGFFKSLVKNLSSALPVKHASVCELLDYSRIHCGMIAGWNGEEMNLDDPFDITDTPCKEMIAGVVSCYSDNVRESFPNDKLLEKMNAKSFAGVPFFNSSLKTIGFLAVADDKPIVDQSRTISVLRVFASRAGAELERLRGEEIIKNMAYFDSLTGLPNRDLLSDRSEKVLSQAKNNKSRFAVLFLDFDRFKPINDKFGHAMGDLLLRIMADRIANKIRNTDTLARLGGDEFILLLPDVHQPENALNIANKLNAIGREPVNLGGNRIVISFSIGISIFPIDGDDINLLMKKADKALYESKSKGGDTFSIFGESDKNKS
jgi:diguanylate cyclase (GGDEF)-like protein